MHRHPFVYQIIPILLLFYSACAGNTPASSDTGPRDISGSLQSGGYTRTYIVHLPPASAMLHPAPLMIALHGRLGTGTGQGRLTHFDQLADSYGFIVVYPDGYQRSWADGRGVTPADKASIDDVAFISALIDQLSSQYSIDQTRIYAAGMSNGGYMTQRLACDLTKRFAAVAVVAANFSANLASHCAPTRPLPIMIIHGMADPLVLAAGGTEEGASVLSTQASVQKWASLDGCSSTPALSNLPDTVNDGTHIQRYVYQPCQNKAEVIFYNVQGGGHTWPGGLQYLPVSVIGKTSRNLDASAVIWQFFQQYKSG